MGRETPARRGWWQGGVAVNPSTNYHCSLRCLEVTLMVGCTVSRCRAPWCHAQQTAALRSTALLAAAHHEARSRGAPAGLCVAAARAHRDQLPRQRFRQREGRSSERAGAAARTMSAAAAVQAAREVPVRPQKAEAMEVAETR